MKADVPSTIKLLWTACTALASVAILALAAGVGNPKSPERTATLNSNDPNGLVLRVYDVKDLLLPRVDRWLPRDLTVPTELGMIGYWTVSAFHGRHTPEGRFGFGHLTPEVMADLVISSVGRSAWLGGGGRGYMHCAGSLLVVVQSPRNHEVVEELLAALRQANKRQRALEIVAWWVLADPEQAKRLAPGLNEMGLPAPVDPQVMRGARVLYQGRTMCLDGLATCLWSGPCQTVVSGIYFLCNGGGATSAMIETVCWGAVAEIRASVCPDGHSATVELRSTLTRPEKLGMIPWTDLCASGTGRVYAQVRGTDRLDFAVQSMATRTKVPLGRPVIVGGTSAPLWGRGKLVYLILEVSACPEGKP